MAWDWLWAGRVDQVVHLLDHWFLFGPGRKYSQLQPALSWRKEKEALALDSILRRQQNDHDSTICTGAVAGWLLQLQTQENLDYNSSLSLSLTSALIFHQQEQEDQPAS